MADQMETAGTDAGTQDNEQPVPSLDPAAAAAVAEAPQMTPAQREAVNAALSIVVGRLSRLFQTQVGMRGQIEERWLRDLRAFHGRYEPDVEADLTTQKRSRVFVKATRKKTNAWEARLYDMLFPTDDDNWDIQPTPNPELAEKMNAARSQAQGMLEQATQMHSMGQAEQAKGIAQAVEDGPGAEHQKLKAIDDEAKARCAKMRREISDQLAECHYNIKCRDMIHDLCRLGTGVLKGPLTSSRIRKRWKKNLDNKYVMEMLDDARPDIRRVDLWHYFPDMTATDREDCEFDFERYMKTRSGMQKLSQMKGYDKAAILELLKNGSLDVQPDFIARLRTITGVDQASDPRWIVVEYCGPLEDAELDTILRAMVAHDDPAYADRAKAIVDLIASDPLMPQQFIVTFCQDKLLKFGLHPLDSGESLYSTIPFERDESTIFGLGIPNLMQGSQAALNGSWRMILDNAALSVGPQIVIDKKAIVPEDGSYEMTSRKVWLMTTTQLAGAQALFQLHNIQNNQGELMNIVEMSLRFVDDESSMPTIAEGEQGTQETKTSSGMALLMNSANVVFRRVVRNFDDCITTPTIGRMYDWNMQHNDNEDLKGDMEVVAKGSSVLLVREIQAPNLMAITSQWSVHPVIGPMLKTADAARKTANALMIPADEILKTDEELLQAAEEAKSQPPQPSEIDQKGQWDLKLEKERSNRFLQGKNMDRDTAMMVEAARSNSTRSQSQSKENIEGAKIGSKERTFNAEAALAAKLPPAAAQTVAGGAQAA